MLKLLNPRTAIIALLTVHLLLTLSVVSPRVVFSGQPIAVDDYALHFCRAVTVDELQLHHGRSWGYNPFFMAGYPAGTVYDVNNHFIEQFVTVLHRLGVSPPVSFNLLVFIGILLGPVLVWLAAYNFRLTPIQQVIAVILSMWLWFGDSHVRLLWQDGVIASAMAMYSLPFSISCFHRYREDRTWFWFACFLISATLISLLHPLSFLFFYIPVAAFLAIRVRSFDLRFWITLVAFAGSVLLVNWFWMAPLIHHLFLKTASGNHYIGNLNVLLRDLVGQNDSGLRLLIYILAGGGLVSWWREGRKELVELLLFIVVALTLSGYVAGEWTFFRNLETYRNNMVASFLLILPAAVFASTAVSYFFSLQRQQRWVVIVVALSFGLNLFGRNLLWFGPYVRGHWTRNALRPLEADEAGIVEWLRKHVDKRGRILVEPWPLGDLLPWYAGLQVIGGPDPQVWMPHNFANYSVIDHVVLFGRDIGQFSPEECGEYLRAYNISWVVAYTPESKEFFGHCTKMTPATNIGQYRVYRNEDTPTFFLTGAGEVDADYGDLRVSRASAGDIVLKYHWSFTLEVDPPQAIQPKRVLDDPVPFIEIPNNRYTDFVIRDVPRWRLLPILETHTGASP